MADRPTKPKQSDKAATPREVTTDQLIAGVFRIKPRDVKRIVESKPGRKAK